VTDRQTGPVQSEALGTASHVAAIASVAIAVVGALFLRRTIQWPGDRNDLVLLSAVALYLAAQAAWFFNARWRLLGDPADARVRNIFLPIATYFALRLLLDGHDAARDGAGDRRHRLGAAFLR
jgi:hypothetical protein